VHLEPVDPAAGPPEKVQDALERVQRARRILGQVEPAGPKPDLDVSAAVKEVLAIARRGEERRHQLGVLAREASRLAMWGELRTEQLGALAKAGVPLRFYGVPAAEIGQVRAECVAVLAELSGKRRLVAVIQREGEPDLPEGAREIDPPERDLPSVRAEARELDEAMAADADRLAELAGLQSDLAREETRLQSEAQFAAALSGALARKDLFAVQGWAPADRAEGLSGELAGRDISAGVDLRDPAPEEQPPTLIEYPRWATPIKGLFDILGTSPGYREFDVSAFFMIALPVFAAMLIGDAGYGLLFVLLPLVLYRKAVAAAGKDKIHLVMVFGVATIIWGVLTGTYFGVTPKNLIGAGGLLAAVGSVLDKLQVIRGDMEQQTQTIMKLSFLFGTVHLSCGQLRQALKFFPDQRFLEKVGWTAFLWGMLGVVWYLFFDSQAEPPRPFRTEAGHLLIGGAALAILFAHPSRNPLKRIGIGLASFPLAAVSTFSDTISYIRLMAVGMASVVIAQTFNGLGAQCAAAATWIAGAPIVVIGHALNIALCLIALLAHGVRLNMLEFSSNAGVEWGGYAYQPFAKIQAKET